MVNTSISRKKWRFLWVKDNWMGCLCVLCVCGVGWGVIITFWDGTFYYSDSVIVKKKLLLNQTNVSSFFRIHFLVFSYKEWGIPSFIFLLRPCNYSMSCLFVLFSRFQQIHQGWLSTEHIRFGCKSIVPPMSVMELLGVVAVKEWRWIIMVPFPFFFSLAKRYHDISR